ncbi:hypothetical protein [Paenisporosarcina sp. TG20]|nr:hypothetical protein [Paenisporosarcina sp. TG20]
MKKSIFLALILIISFSALENNKSEELNSLQVSYVETNSVPIHPPV